MWNGEVQPLAFTTSSHILPIGVNDHKGFNGGGFVLPKGCDANESATQRLKAIGLHSVREGSSC